MQITHQCTPGACFHDAFMIAAELFLQHNVGDVAIVHGIAVGTGGEILGRRYAHAWVEIEFDGAVLVIDHSFPNHPVSREAYYKVGKINPDECRRYTIRQATKHAKRTGHTGPWVPAPAGVL